MKYKLNSGFTIIELIVVIAIIAVLAIIVLTNVNKYISKARDAARVADIAQIQKALEMYYIDNNAYPSFTGWTCSNNYLCGTQWSAFAGALQPTYIGNLPVDPINSTHGLISMGNGNYLFQYEVYNTTSTFGSCKGYVIMYELENGPATSPGFTDCHGQNSFNYNPSYGTNIVEVGMSH